MHRIEMCSKEILFLSIISIILSGINFFLILRSIIANIQLKVLVFEFILYDLVAFFIILNELLNRRKGSYVHFLMLFYFLPVIYNNPLNQGTVPRVLVFLIIFIKVILIHRIQYCEKYVVTNKIYTIIRLKADARRTAKISIKLILYTISFKNIFIKQFLTKERKYTHNVMFIVINGLLKTVEFSNLLQQYLIELFSIILLIGIKWIIVTEQNTVCRHTELFSLFVSIIYMLVLTINYEIETLKMAQRTKKNKPNLC